jgi:hypothetical protein
MNIIKNKQLAALQVCLLVLIVALFGCGGSSDCGPTVILPDPTGRWAGTMTREESDCGDLTRGAQFSFEHYVSSRCDANDDSSIYLVDEDSREFQETTSTSIGGGSFTVQYEGQHLTIDISYDNYDGSLADVTQKIRQYQNGRLHCSERYRGQARK